MLRFLSITPRKLTAVLLSCVILIGLPLINSSKAEAALPVCDQTIPGGHYVQGDFMYYPSAYGNNGDGRDCAMKNHYQLAYTPGICDQTNTPRCNPVLTLQWALKTCYGSAYRFYGNTEITADGDFGPATAKMLAFAQNYENRGKINKVAVDGVFGPRTRDTLMWPVYRVPSNRDWRNSVYQGRCSSL